MLRLAAQPLHLLHQLAAVPHRQDLGAEPHLHLLADQPRRHRVHVALDPDRAPPAHAHPRPLQRLQPARRQRPQPPQLLGQPLAPPRVPPGHHRQHELPVPLPGREIAATPQQQRLLHRLLEPPMALFAVAVLVAARRVRRLRLQPVVPQQRPVPRRVLLGTALVMHRQRHPVRPVPPRRPAPRPQGVLQALAQAGEALGETQSDVLPIRGRQHEVVGQVRERLAGDRHPQRVHAREVRGPQPPRLVSLREEHLLGRSVLRLPLAHAPLQRPAAPPPVLGRLLAPQPLQQRLGLQLRLTLQQLLEAAPDRGQRIGSRPPGVRPRGRAGELVEIPVLACGLAIHARFHRRGAQRCSLAKALAQFLDLGVSHTSSLSHRQLLR